MSWKLTKDLTHPMWGGMHIPQKIHKFPTVEELNRPPKPPAPTGFTYTWTGINSKNSLNSKIGIKK